MKRERNSNIELLRIISIMMVVLQHYTIHNGISNNTLNISFNRLLLELISLGNIGVIIFIIITGYFCINQEKTFKLKKLFNLYMQVLFYSITIYIGFVLFGKEQFSILELVKCMLPIAFKKYWFICVYVILYIFIPYINKILKSLKRSEHFNFIVIGLLIFSILHMFTGQDYYGNEFIQFILYYTIGAYLGKYNNNIFMDKKKNIIILTFMSIVIILSVLILDLVGTKYSIFGMHSTYLMNRTSIFSILFSVCIFNVLNNRKKFTSKFINKISSCVLGVYLISDNELIRKILWTDIFKVYKYVSSNLLILHMLGCLIITFIVCIMLDYIRKKTFGKFLNILYDWLVKNIQNFKIYKKIVKLYGNWSMIENDRKI